MTIPQLSGSDVARFSRQVAAYIAGQRANYQNRSVALGPAQRTAMARFFEPAVLDSAHLLVLSASSVDNPPFYRELLQLGFSPEILPDFTQMAAVTFVDTIVSQGPFTEPLLFHELVHVVQFAKLGLEGFAKLYVQGFLCGGSYFSIPLERNAYELEARFAAAPLRGFWVASEVQDWIDAGRFGPAVENGGPTAF